MPAQFAKWKLETNTGTIHTPTSHQLPTITNGFRLPNQFSLDSMWFGWYVCNVFSEGVLVPSKLHKFFSLFLSGWLRAYLRLVYLDSRCTYHIFLSFIILFGLTHDLARCIKISDANSQLQRGGQSSGAALCCICGNDLIIQIANRVEWA